MAKFIRLTAALIAALMFPFAGAQAGLDLENQTEVKIGALDLDHDGRIGRKEVAEYMFFYFDHDGNESLTKGEYHADRPITVIPDQGGEITLIDIDNDGRDDGVEYTTDTFLKQVMIGERDPEESTVKAYNFLDVYFLRLDTDKSRAIELDEWQKEYEKHAAIKPNQAPKAANEDYYAD